MTDSHRYDAFRDHLLKQDGDEVRLTIGDVQRIAGVVLPASAYGRHWWLNDHRRDGRHCPWTQANWYVAGFDRRTRTVTFRRGPTPNGTRWGRHANTTEGASPHA